MRLKFRGAVIFMSLFVIGMSGCSNIDTPEAAFNTTVERFKKGDLEGIKAMLVNKGAVIYWTQPGKKGNRAVTFDDVNCPQTAKLLKENLSKVEFTIIERGADNTGKIHGRGFSFGFKKVDRFTEENTTVEDSTSPSGKSNVAEIRYELFDKKSNYKESDTMVFKKTPDGWKHLMDQNLLWRAGIGYSFCK
jgi:hypothetical protein